MLSTGNAAYVRGIGKSKDDVWYVYRKGNALVDPDTNQTLAYEAVYLGTAQVTRPGEPGDRDADRYRDRRSGAGDKLVAAGRPQPVNYAPRAPSSQIKGRVMAIYGGVGKVGEAGPQQVISINRGKADGVEVGHVLALYTLGGTRA